MSTIQSLWPDNLTGHASNAPVALLREQAEALATATDNKLRARVETIGYKQHYTVTQASLGMLQPQFRHRMVIVVPSLENYELEILNLYQGLEAYPVAAESKASAFADTLRDQDALIAWLKKTLGSEATKKTLSTLLSLAA